MPFCDVHARGIYCMVAFTGHWEQECAGLAGTCLRAAHQIIAVECKRNRVGLDWGRCVVAHEHHVVAQECRHPRRQRRESVQHRRLFSTRACRILMTSSPTSRKSQVSAWMMRVRAPSGATAQCSAAIRMEGHSGMVDWCALRRTPLRMVD